MDWITRLNNAITYMEENMANEMDYAHLAQIACCSSYQFQRMFTYIAGVSVPEYLRRRKMSLAAVDLQSGGKVIDVALKYGYTSPTAFNRAYPTRGFHFRHRGLGEYAVRNLVAGEEESLILSLENV